MQLLRKPRMQVNLPSQPIPDTSPPILSRANAPIIGFRGQSGPTALPARQRCDDPPLPCSASLAPLRAGSVWLKHKNPASEPCCPLLGKACPSERSLLPSLPDLSSGPLIFFFLQSPLCLASCWSATPCAGRFFSLPQWLALPQPRCAIRGSRQWGILEGMLKRVTSEKRYSVLWKESSEAFPPERSRLICLLYPKEDDVCKERIKFFNGLLRTVKSVI
jgi:hypothetical protein